MIRRFRLALVGVAVCSMTGILSSNASAGTILKLGLGGDSPADVTFDGTTLMTIDDTDGSTLGDQNTNVEFQDFLSFIPDILTPTASFTLDDLIVAGPALVIAGTLVVQEFTGGTMMLYDPSDVLLLSATLDLSTLTGPIGPPATGALFTTTFGMVTGGTLAPLIDPDSLTMSMSLTDVNGGSGFSVTGVVAPVLDPFEADVTLNIAAEQVPEPATAVLLLLGAALVTLFAAQRRR